jgi:PAS domain S-box-containing protein
VLDRPSVPGLSADRILRLLIVEDSEDDARLIEREIRRGGFEVEMTRVENAVDMRVELLTNAFDLIISDHTLPGSSIEETLAVFRESPEDIPFLIVSGTIGEEAAGAALREGASDYLPKDRLGRLVAVIERELAQADERRTGREARARLVRAEAEGLKEETERARVFEVLHEVSTASSGVLEVAKLADLTIRGALELVGGDDAMVRWWDAKTKRLRLLGTTDSRDWDQREDVAPALSILGESFLKQRAIVNNDYQRAGKAVTASRKAGVTALVAVPLLVGDRAVGALGVVSYQKRRFTHSHAKILGFLASQVAAAIEAAHVRAELVDSVSLLEQSQEVGAIGTFVAWLTPEKAGRDQWSPQAIKIFGYTEKTFDGSNEAFWERVHPDDIDWVRKAQAEAYETGSIYDLSHRIVRPDGEVRWIHERAAVQRDAAGKPIRFLGVTRDITDQELASQALKESVQRFTGAFEGSGIGMALMSPDGVYRLVNNALCKMLGYERVDLLGKPARDFMYEPDFLPSLPVFGRLMSGEDATHVFEGRYKHRDGHLVWARLHASVSRTEDGEIGFYVSQVEDITESVAAVAALVASEARNAAVIDATLDAMIVIDAAAVVTAFNPAAERMFGYRKDEVIGREMAEMIIPERFREAHREGVRKNVESGAGGLPRRIELIALRADGTEFPIELSMSRLETDGTPFFSGSIRDLTDRDRLGESQALLAKVVAAAPVILFACDAEGTVRLAEGRAIALLGVGAGLAVGSNVFDVLASVPEAIEHVRRGLAGESFVGAIHLEAVDLWFEASYDPIRDDGGEVIGMVALATDVSDRVRGDAARQESDAKSRLVAIVNHELRTPLTSILGFTELLKLDRVGPLNPKQTRYVDNVESAGRHLLALINDSLDLSKLAAGKMDLQITGLAVAPIVQEAASQVQPLLDEKGLEIELDVGCELWVEADRRRLLQILWNLLSNAIRHTAAGGKLAIRCLGTEAAVEIAVSDSGVGMAADQLERIFEDYTQVGVRADGTGLGLPVSRRLAQLMGGDIGVVSQLGAGSSFTIILPAASPPKEDNP